MEKLPDICKRKPGIILIISLIVLTIAVYSLVVGPTDDNLHVSFLDVGQGDAILIQKGSNQVLIDGGPSPETLNLRLGEKMAFWDRTIELVILTHPSSDHITGLVDVLDKYRVERVAFPEMECDGSGIYDQWLQILDDKKCPCTLVNKEQSIYMGEHVLLEVLNPGEAPLTGTSSDIDNNGLVLRLSLGDISFLFTADIMWETELELIYSRAKLDSNVLKVAHHGSDTSTTERFLKVASPDVAVISVGDDNEYGHPDGTVLDRLIKEVGAGNIYRTDKYGTVEFVTNGEKMWLNTGD